MKKRGVVIDSLVDLPPFFKTSLPLKVVGFKVYINGKEYTDGKDITKEEFYEMVSNDTDLRTSYPPPAETYRVYKELEDEGVEEILAIHLPAKVSGFLSSLSGVLSKIKAKVKVIDSRSLSGGAGFVAAKLIELFEKGLSFEEIERKFHEVREKLHVQFGVPTLKYLIKNGRIGKAKGLIGTLLNILPVLTVDSDGEVAPIAKVRGKKRLIYKMVDNILEFVGESGIIDVVIGWGLDVAKGSAMALKEHLFKNLGDRIKNYGEIRISPTVACHSGPEIFGVAVYVH